MIQVVAFDADDTLWHNESHFQETQLRLAAIVERYAPREVVEARLEATERRNIRHFGFGIKGFTLSMIETAIEISKGEIAARDIQEIVELGRSMLAAPLELIEGVEEVLDALSERYRLFLITKGDLLDQRNKIERSGLAERFEHIEVVSHKDARTYRTLFATRNAPPEATMMVGNSLPSDVLPVVEIGGHAAFVPYHVTALHERYDEIPDHPRLHRLERVTELPALLRRLGAGAQRTR